MPSEHTPGPATIAPDPAPIQTVQRPGRALAERVARGARALAALAAARTNAPWPATAPRDGRTRPAVVLA
jgi:hypothetical protein